MGQMFSKKSNKMKSILVTGANKGIGFAIVRRILLDIDNSFVYLGARSIERGQDAVEKLESENADWKVRLKVVELDVTDDNSVKNAAAAVSSDLKTHQNLSPLYAIVNNAGLLSRDKIDEVLDVNVYGVLRVVNHFKPLLDQAKGRIVNLSSESGPMFTQRCSKEVKDILVSGEATWDEIENLIQKGKRAFKSDKPKENIEALGMGYFEGFFVYEISKAALNAYTIHLARQVEQEANGKPHIAVNACTPGMTETDMLYSTGMFDFDSSDREKVKASGMRSPDEGAKSTLYLLTEKDIGNGLYYDSSAKQAPYDKLETGYPENK